MDQGFQTKEDQWASMSPEELEMEKSRLSGMWKFGLSLLPRAYSTANDVVDK